MLIDGISRKQLELEAIKALIDAQTMAGDRVFEPRDWPTSLVDFPILLLQAPRERKLSLHPGGNAFTTTISLVAVGRVWADDAQLANDAIDEFSSEIENALMLTPDFVNAVQQFVSIETRSTVSAEGKYHVGEIGMTFELTVYQMYGPGGPPLTDIRSRLQRLGCDVPIIIDSHSTSPEHPYAR